MRTESLFILGIAAFFGVVATIYWFWSYEWGGTAMLIGSVLLGLLPGTYYYWWHRRMKPRPEDRSDATLEEGAGVIGAFPDSSIWPFVAGMGIFLITLSAVWGYWLAAPGAVALVAAAVGYTVESRRGGTV